MNHFSAAVLLAIVGIGWGAPRDRIFENSLENIERLNNLQPGELAEELSGQFEGDMILTEEQYRDMTRRNGYISTRYRWPNRTVYYEIATETFNEGQVNAILRAIHAIENATCIKYRPRDPNNPAYIRIHGDGSGCSATVGYGRRTRNLNLGRGCLQPGTIQHELIHGLGFRHMQSTYNRDEYVKVLWENIIPGKEGAFSLSGKDVVSNFGTEYDYRSVMHYSARAFSKNGKPTMEALKDKNIQLGQRTGMTERDILKINRMYNCTEKL